ncbi:MAG: cobalt-precorrin-5B (C(1))-methyltransferase CbiD [Deltaproteobacteria bacterium]|nr:cobalt-precorrin-5B (C(1))-methyltransferase CbiD [Deltaproteobacteria bacterium]
MTHELRKGYTTGTCAQAASKASAIMLFEKKVIDEVSIVTPIGVPLRLPIVDQKVDEDFARCAVIKDAGDEPDVTDKIKVYSTVRVSEKPGITIKGGEGIGIVTKAGLPIPKGEYAINPVPRMMIIKELSQFLIMVKGLEVIISVPLGEEIAKRTFNPKLGIVGGISILGTTGFVEPRSVDAYKTSLVLQLDMVKASGHKRVALVLGYLGERYCREVLGLSEEMIVRVGDHVGFMVGACKEKGFKEVILAGYLGKLVKIAKGQLNTHKSFGDLRIETIATYAESQGAKKETVERILNERSAQATVEIIEKAGLSDLFDMIAKDVVKALSSITDSTLDIRCFVLSLEGRLLGLYPKGGL